ncbi:MAG TPA: TonB-dependent receptor [Caulobacteraceae bacterium]|jgi:outer membrane receptor protein involved in Fe transport
MLRANRRATLLVTTALAASGLATAAFAQGQTATTNSNAIEEVVVTATRQTSTVNKVALSVSAVTQKNLDQQGIRSVSDLSSQVPGFTFRVSGGDNNPQLTLRGIGGNAIGGTSGSAPTTGVYIDDIPLMKRNANGLETGSGSPTPLLYDLDRVEVLRGPQGTLYGGSSEGGTLRFITPQPSLTTYSGSARVGWSTMQGGGMGNEEGLALGGPLVQDKLGFRISGFRQDRPGWVNDYSEFDGHQTASQVNKGNDYSLRGALLWQVTPDFKVNVSVFNQMNYDQDSSTVRTSSPAVTIPKITFNNGQLNNAGQLVIPVSGRKDCNGNALPATSPLQTNCVAWAFQNTSFGGYTIPAQTWFANNNGTANGLYLSPTNVQYVPSPRRTMFTTPSVTLDYTWNDKLDFKSITADTSDETGGWTFGGGGANREIPGPAGSGFALGDLTGLTGAQTAPASALSKGTAYTSFMPGSCPTGAGLVTPILSSSCLVGAQYAQMNGANGPANVFGYYLFNNRRNQVTQEFRVSTIDPSMRLQIVAGAYIEHEHNHVNVGSNWNENLVTTQFRGISEAYTAGGVYPAPTLQVPGANAVDVSTRNIDILEDEQSVFANATFAVTSKFKIEAGFRYSNYTQNFNQQYGGSVAGVPSGPGVAFQGTSSTGQTVTVNGITYPFETNPNSTTAFPLNYASCPTSVTQGATNPGKYAGAGCPYQYSHTTLNEHPLTPKVGASYQLTASDLLYVTYAEGQRPGGINPPSPPVQCAQDLANLGLSVTPQTYQHDTVKSTEVGGKFRLFNGQAQINASAFHIEWDNVQFVVPEPLCAFSFIANAGTAASDGGEVQATARLMGFTFNGNVAYDNARYTQTVRTTAGTILANKGDNLGVPDWTANAGLQYDTRLFDLPAYARMDYAYTGKYLRSTTLGSSSFQASVTPNTINGNETHIMNARVGIYYKDLEIAGYVKNMFDSQEWINKGQGTGSYYFSGQTVQPRIIGVQMNYRF